MPMVVNLLEKQARMCYIEPVCSVIHLSVEHCWCASGAVEKYEEFDIDWDE